MAKYWILLILVPSVSLAQLCYPGDDLAECAKKAKRTRNIKKVLFAQNETCLGTQKDSLAFLGLCTDSSSGCQSGLSSSLSLDCGSGSICCKDSGQWSHNGISYREQSPWTYDIVPVPVGNLEYLNQQGCGSSRVRYVLGGHKAPEGGFPFIVSFTQNVSHPKEWKTFCGGVMISPRHVLTAAHCFDKLDDSLWDYHVRVRVGVSDLKHKIPEFAERRKSYAKIKKVFLHPRFKRKVRGYLNPFNDIAVVELHFLRGSHKTVCLPTQIRVRKEETGATGVVAGFGSTSATSNTKPEHLVYAHVNPVQYAKCKEQYADFVGNIPGDVYIGNNVLCAGDNVTDACSGDSGSPLLWVDDLQRWSVVGVVSFGPSVCGQQVPGAYTKVESYLDFIKNIIS